MPRNVGLGDALRALHALGALEGGDTRGAVLGLLGWSVAPEKGAAPPDRPPSPLRPDPPRRPPVDPRLPPPPLPAPAAPTVEIEAIAPASSPAPARPAPRRPDPATTRPPPPDPLLEPVRTRSVLTALAGAHLPIGPLDVRACVRAQSADRELRRLPRLPRPTLRRGVRVVVDRGDGLAPFRFDVDALVAGLEAWVGRERVEVVDWRGEPLGERPDRDGPVQLVVAAPGADARAWAGFRQAPWVILSPYSAARWGALAGRLPLVTWNRALTASAVHAARRRRG